MGDRDEATRTVASCDDCGSVYAAVELPGGKIQPIGKRTGCSCGSTSFSKLDSTTVFDSSSPDDDEASG